MYDRRAIFRTAWAKARDNHRRYGRTLRYWFRFCLIGTWKTIKTAWAMQNRTFEPSTPFIDARRVYRFFNPTNRFANARI